MAKAFKCDRCEKYFDGTPDKYEFKRSDLLGPKELCWDCMLLLIQITEAFMHTAEPMRDGVHTMAYHSEGYTGAVEKLSDGGFHFRFDKKGKENAQKATLEAR
jgi:hypothetical protein